MVSIIFSLASILATASVYSTVGIGSAYAQNGLSGFIPLPPDEGVPTQEPVLPEAVPQQSTPNGLSQPMQSQDSLAGNRFGIVIGSEIGARDGVNARSSGLGFDPANSYQQPTDEAICQVFQDFYGTISLNASSSICDQRFSQQQQIDFFEGFSDGYENGYVWGFVAGYSLDEHYLSQTQPPTGQSPTQAE